MIKLIAMDMDGTLLNDDHATISQRNLDALHAAAEQGIEVVIASGRTWSLLEDIARNVGVVRYVLIWWFALPLLAYVVSSTKLCYTNTKTVRTP